jgi:hypothetical protein
MFITPAVVPCACPPLPRCSRTVASRERQGQQCRTEQQCSYYCRYQPSRDDQEQAGSISITSLREPSSSHVHLTHSFCTVGLQRTLDLRVLLSGKGCRTFTLNTPSDPTSLLLSVPAVLHPTCSPVVVASHAVEGSHCCSPPSQQECSVRHMPWA